MHSISPRPARCLVTGASGFIGGRLCERLAEQGEQQYVPLVRNVESAIALRQRWPQLSVADLLNAAQVDKALEGCDAVVHLAHDGRGAAATRRLVDIAVKRGVKRFVHVSSMSVHGPVPGPEAAHEATARIGRYDHDYSDSKAEQEEIVQGAHDRGDLPVVILRPTIVYGPRSHFVSQIIEQARGGAVSMFDQGGGVCNVVYIDDVCDAIDAALTHDAALGQAMFINGDDRVVWGDFIKAFAAFVKPPPALVSLSSSDAIAFWSAHPQVLSSGLSQRIATKLKRLAGWRDPVAPWPPLGRVQRETFPIVFANSKAKQRLEWTPKVSFEQGVALTGAWLASDEGMI